MTATLTEALLPFIAKLPPLESDEVLRRIKTTTGASLGSLRGALTEYKKAGVGEQSPSHSEIAAAVVESFGNGCLLFAASAFWAWRGRGVWDRLDSSEIRQCIQRVLTKMMPRFTAHTVGSVAKILEGLVFEPRVEFESGPDAVNCLNGELRLDDIGIWYLEPHKRKHYRTTQLPLEWDQKATAPQFMQFLREVFAPDGDCEAKVLLVLELIGYSCTTSTSFEKFIILVGRGANGKSVLLAALTSLLGTSNVSAVQPVNFGSRFQLAHLEGKIANIVTELPEGKELPDDAIKSLVSGELVTAERKLQPPFDFHPFATIWAGT
ncbi:MAG: hypothetical protein KZQ77_13740, partial [Candidatus Thiodiazotropha sp. (ex Notomyrtea botanica)]|nr:hypothetical protein [Candidatus Thiodiazotropha sp. (ex Notomyrtea botanica)]